MHSALRPTDERFERHERLSLPVCHFVVPPCYRTQRRHPAGEVRAARGKDETVEAFPATSPCTRSTSAPQSWLGSSSLHPFYSHPTSVLICPQFNTRVTILPEQPLISLQAQLCLLSGGSHELQSQKLGMSDSIRAPDSRQVCACRREPGRMEGRNLGTWQTSSRGPETPGERGR